VILISWQYTGEKHSSPGSKRKLPEKINVNFLKMDQTMNSRMAFTNFYPLYIQKAEKEGAHKNRGRRNYFLADEI